MPKIEIVSLRFNLDKEDDHKLFALLQYRAPSGKRSELIKQIVNSALRESAGGGKSTARRAKEPPCELVDTTVSTVTKEAHGPMQTSATVSRSRPDHYNDTRSDGKRDGMTGAKEPEQEAANLVGSLVQ